MGKPMRPFFTKFLCSMAIAVGRVQLSIYFWRDKYGEKCQKLHLIPRVHCTFNYNT